jgi:release factor glutamine methyltransferase
MTEQELMLTHIRKCRRIDLYIDPRPLDDEEEAIYEDLLAKRQDGEPLQYLLGESEFMGLKFHVNHRVLIPRPETEILVELAVRKLLGKAKLPHGVRILDLGTGSGNIAISLAKLLHDVSVTTMDYSLPSLEVAKKNARLNGVAKKIDFVHADLFKELRRSKAGENTFDLIISNPPYIPSFQLSSLPKDVQREPRLALDGGEDGLNFYRHILAHAGAYLSEGGLLMMEIGDEQRTALEAMLSDHRDFPNFEFYPDYQGTDRIVAAYSQ